RREAGEMRIDRGISGEGIERLRARPHEIDLARQAFAGADAACYPVGLDRLPGWIGKPFENEIGRVPDRNRAVEVDENPNARVGIPTRSCPQHRLLRPHASCRCSPSCKVSINLDCRSKGWQSILAA